jgi:hypothetical protein
MTIEDLAKEYANRHLDVSDKLGRYLVEAVFLDGAEYQREKQDEFTILFGEWLDSLTAENIGNLSIKKLLEIFKVRK